MNRQHVDVIGAVCDVSEPRARVRERVKNSLEVAITSFVTHEKSICSTN